VIPVIEQIRSDRNIPFKEMSTEFIDVAKVFVELGKGVGQEVRSAILQA
jgi:hypothetical protein